MTEAVLKRLNTAILLDEVEKKDLKVLNLFYQVFDKKIMNEGKDRDNDFKNTFISLLATDIITGMGGPRSPWIVRSSLSQLALC